MYHVSAQGVDERMINVHYYYNNINDNNSLVITHHPGKSRIAYASHLNTHTHTHTHTHAHTQTLSHTHTRSLVLLLFCSLFSVIP